MAREVTKVDGKESVFFDEGDLVEVLKEYKLDSGFIVCKAGEFAEVTCCGEELGGARNLRLVVDGKDLAKVKQFLITNTN